MRDNKIFEAWNRMNPDRSTKEKILQQVQAAMDTRERKRFPGNFRRFAVGFVASALFLLGSFSAVYAASPAFREYVHSLLFPLYAPDEMISIDNGHMTGSFDISDVLLSFLDKFNNNEFGNEITAMKEDGYHYSLFTQNENRILAFVDSNMEGNCIAVYMEQIAYENTEGIWQVTGYQVIGKSIAEDMKKQLEPYSEHLENKILPIPQEDTAIKGEKDSILIYNANEKENIVLIKEEDEKVLRDILAACNRNGNIKGELFQYVIKIDSTSYMFDSNGNGIVNTADKERYGIAIAENELGIITALFEQYGVSLEEVKQ